MKRPGSTVLAARFSGEIVATIMLGHDGHRGWVYYLAVARAFCGQSVAGRMIRAAENGASAAAYLNYS
jgi:hypothetical protein